MLYIRLYDCGEGVQWGVEDALKPQYGRLGGSRNVHHEIRDPDIPPR